MANMDDYYRAANQSTECTELSEVGQLVADNATDSDELGTRNDFDAALDRTDASELMGPVAAECDAFCHFFDDESAVASALESTLPIFPNSGSSLSSGEYHNLLSTTAQRTVGTAAHLRNRSSTFDLSIDELQRFVTDTSNDETEPQRSELFRNERPTEVVQLIASALECVREWSPPTQPPTQTPPPLRPYASIEDVSRAFTLNERQHAAFTLIVTSLLQRFLRQELGSVHGNGGGYRTENFEARFRDDQLLMLIGGAGGTGKSRVIDAVDTFCASWHTGSGDLTLSH